MSGEAKNRENRDVRVPMDYYRRLGRYFDELKLMVLDEAMNEAAADASKKPGTAAVTVDDILNAAARVLPTAETRLNTALRQVEPDNDRRKAS